MNRTFTHGIRRTILLPALLLALLFPTTWAEAQCFRRTATQAARSLGRFPGGLLAERPFASSVWARKGHPLRGLARKTPAPAVGQETDRPPGGIASVVLDDLLLEAFAPEQPALEDEQDGVRTGLDLGHGRRRLVSTPPPFQGLRCIFLVAESEKLQDLQDLRLRLDPLALDVPPHITVVFPFDLPMPTRDLQGLLMAARPRSPIAFSLGAPTVLGEALAFPVEQGAWDIAALHDRLYGGLPARPAEPYYPHLTFGRAVPGRASRSHLDLARSLLPFHGMVRRLVLERIGEDGESIPEFEASCP